MSAGSFIRKSLVATLALAATLTFGACAAFQPWAEISQRLRRIYQIDLGPQILPVRRIIQILGGAVA